MAGSSTHQLISKREETGRAEVGGLVGGVVSDSLLFVFVFVFVLEETGRAEVGGLLVTHH